LEIGSHQQKGVGHVQEEVVGWQSKTKMLQFVGCASTNLMDLAFTELFD